MLGDRSVKNITDGTQLCIGPSRNRRRLQPTERARLVQRRFRAERPFSSSSFSGAGASPRRRPRFQVLVTSGLFAKSKGPQTQTLKIIKLNLQPPYETDMPRGGFMNPRRRAARSRGLSVPRLGPRVAGPPRQAASFKQGSQKGKAGKGDLVFSLRFSNHSNNEMKQPTHTSSGRQRIVN